MTTVHVVGAGVAGLAAATAAVAEGYGVVLYDSAPQAGGRCRSFADPTLGAVIDNGSHLILSGNASVARYIERTGADARFHVQAPARFPFVDLETGERWTLRPGRGPLPFWLADPSRRPPGVGLRGFGRGLGFIVGGKDQVAGRVIGTGPASARFWHPLVKAVLNTAPEAGSAALMRPVLMETFVRGEAWCRPLMARRGLSDALVTPGLDYMRARGGSVRLGARLDALILDGDRCSGLHLGGVEVALGAYDHVVLATPPWITAEMLPGLPPPPAYSPIVNVHFRVGAADGPPPSLLGLVGASADWVFRRDDIVSVTVSAAAALVDRPASEIASLLWTDVQRALQFRVELPPYRVIKEKRATPLQTTAAAARRWDGATPWRNLALAGDWIDTGLPATIESAMRSGEQAIRRLVTGTASSTPISDARRTA